MRTTSSNAWQRLNEDEERDGLVGLREGEQTGDLVSFGPFFQPRSKKGKANRTLPSLPFSDSVKALLA